MQAFFHVCFGFGFTLQRSVIGKQNDCKFLNQSEAKSIPIVTCPHLISHAWSCLHAFTSNSEWFVVLFVSVVIGHR